MCDQTEVIYSPGDVVWVKLGPVWWPGQVYDYDKLPEEITANLRKKPLAVVKFFQEDSFEYVKNLNAIYHYSCRRKHEFIKKGLDMCRSNSRDVPSNMKMFPNDISTAEHLTNGDPNILNSKEFAPEEKEDYSDLFGKKTPKKGKTESLKKDNSLWRLKGLSESSLKGVKRHSLPTSSVPRPITHPRFITKALEGRSDHEVRIRQQVLPSGSSSFGCNQTNQYNCHLCNFSSSRINVIVLHNKSHSAGYADAYLPPQQHTGKGRKIKSEKKIVYGSEKRQRISDVIRSDEPPTKRKSVKLNPELNESKQVYTSDRTSGRDVDAPGKSTLLKKPIFGRKKSARDKAEKLAKEKEQNDAFRETLLKDWDEDEDNDISKESDLNIEKDSADSSLNSSDKYDCSNSKRKEISCFDFDDSEDGLNIGETVMKFGQKIPRVFGEKPKKQNKNLLEDNSLNVEKLTSSSGVDDFSNDLTSKNDSSSQLMSQDVAEESEQNENEDLQSAFKSLLDETVAPVIPDAPTHFEIKNKNIDVETSLQHQLQDDGGGGSSHVNSENNDSSVGSRSYCNEKIMESQDCEAVVVNETNKVDTEMVSQPVITKTDDSDVSIEEITKSDHTDVNVREEDVQSSCDGEEKKELSYLHNEHFLVKTSEEVATSSSDAVRLEINAAPDENNVAVSKIETKICNVVEDIDHFSVFNKKSKVATEIAVTVEQIGSEISKSVPNTAPSVSDVFDTNISAGAREILQSNIVTDIEQDKKQVDEINSSPESNILCKTTASDQLSVTKVLPNKPINTSEGNNFQEMDFDINSMPVILSEDVHGQENNISVVSKSNNSLSSSLVTTSFNSDARSSGDSKLIMVKSVTKQSTIDSTAVKLPAILKDDVASGSSASGGKDNKMSPRKVLLSPSKVVAAVSRSPQVATIKVQPSVTGGTKLTVPGGIISPKNVGNTSQVLILKSTTPGQPGKSTLQKISSTSQMIQQGGKVLILTNPQGTAGQSKVISSLSTQQKNLTPAKLTGTRILTTKGTVLTTGSQGMISKANILSGSSKTVTTKSGQKILINKAGVISQTSKSVIINKSGVLTSVNSPSIVTGKSSFITQNILSSKSELAANSHINSSQITVSSKGAAATILTSSGLSTNKSMILTPVTNSKGGLLTGNQKLRLITTSKGNPAASTSSGTKLMFQSAPSRMILPSSSLSKNKQLKLVGNLKGQSNTSTILIQTSQGVIATTPLTSPSQVGSKSKVLKSSLPAVISTSLSPSKMASIQVAQAVSQSQNKLIVQKMKSSGPNILQKTQRKPIQRNNKKPVNQLITPSVSTAQNVQTARVPGSVTSLQSTGQDTLIFSSASGLPLVGQSNVVQGNQLDPGSQTALVYLTLDESGNYRPLESTPVVNYEGAAGDSQTLYIDPGTTDLDNIFLAIDEAGNVVNIAQPVQSTTYTTETSTPPSQDILAKALANTQVLQQETIATENIPLTSSVESSMLSGCMFVEPQTQYPQPSLSHRVLETSLTLNQPIMTPLEVPSAVSPRSLDQIASLQTGFLGESTSLTSNISTCKDEKNNIHPSMPLLSEESDSSASGIVDNKNETVFFTQVDVDGSHAVLTPVTSGSQLAFQLALDENNVIVSSTPGGMSSLGVISSASMPSPSSVSYMPRSHLPASDEGKKLINVSNSSSTVFTNVCQEGNVENFHLTDQLLENQHVIVSGDKTSAGNDRGKNLATNFSDATVSTSAFEIKDDGLKPKDHTTAVSEDSNMELIGTSIKIHEESLLLNSNSGSRSSDDSSVPLQNVAETRTTDNHSEISASQITTNDQRAVNIYNPADSSVDNEQADSKTDNMTAFKEVSFCAESDVLMTDASSVVNGKSDITQTGKRRVDVMSSSSDNLNTGIDIKKFKLDER